MGGEAVVKWRRGISEMPHLELNKSVDGENFGLVDLRIERYPVSQQDKTKLLRSFHEKGVIAPWKNKWLFFGPREEVRWATSEEIGSLEKLPKDWESHMLNVSESTERSPRMTEVFRKR